jgi:hypothetical protein
LNRPWFALLLALAALSALAAAGVAHAEGNCRTLGQVVRDSAQSGYTGFLYANEIASEDRAPGGTAMRGAVASRVRARLEEMVDMSLDAGGYAEEAVATGAIRSGDEARFVAQARQRLHASLLRDRASAAWLLMLVNPSTQNGIVLVRQYEFPRQGLAGLMNGAEQFCERSRLEHASRWPAEKTATSLALLGRGEQPDCGFAATAGLGCSGLRQQLDLAASAGESVFATARSGAVLWVYTRNPRTGRGRALHVEPNGTTLVDAWFFNVDAPPA